jgi:hypothetical protein
VEILGKVYKRKEASHWQQRGFGQGGVYGVYCQTDISAWRGYTPLVVLTLPLNKHPVIAILQAELVAWLA